MAERRRGPSPTQQRLLPSKGGSLTVAGLFAGIGGIELGLHAAGHRTELLCELDDGAQAVLRARFPGVPLVGDVRSIERLPRVDLLTAGFPCQDLSQAGRTVGITGKQSGLVDEVFRLVENPRRSPRWLLLENVPFMLQLERGRAMHHLTRMLSDLGFTWAYRVVDARAFGLPQRRQRVILLASRKEDPRDVLFGDDAVVAPPDDYKRFFCGFYWTEGIRGLGWAVDAVPTLKGGSTIGIPSPPAIWMKAHRTIATPDIRDAERLQGFPAGWTAPATGSTRRDGARWKLVGNAVSVPLAQWVGERLADPLGFDKSRESKRAIEEGSSWPIAAWGSGGSARRVEISTCPRRDPYHHLHEFLEHETKPLSARATAGFLKRTKTGRLNFVHGFIDAVEAHLKKMLRQEAAA